MPFTASPPVRLSSPRKLARLAALVALTLGTSLAGADDLSDIQQLIKSGQSAEALKRIEPLLTAKPKDAQLRFLKGVSLAEQNKAADAIPVFVKLTEDFPELPEPYNNLAVLYAGQGQYDKARTALEMSIRTNPSYATAYENLGDVYAKLASQAYAKALQVDSANPAVAPKLALLRDLFGARPVVASAAPAAPTLAATVAAAKTPPAPAAKPAAPAPAPAPAVVALLLLPLHPPRPRLPRRPRPPVAIRGARCRRRSSPGRRPGARRTSRATTTPMCPTTAVANRRLPGAPTARPAS